MAVFFAEWDKNGAMCRVPECKCVERMAERHAAGNNKTTGRKCLLIRPVVRYCF